MNEKELKCLNCRERLSEDNFFNRKTNKLGKDIWCKKCRRTANYERYLLATYDLTIEDYEDMCETQNYKCAICKSIKHLCVDHNHITGSLRGLLCSNCNTAIGLLGDNYETIKKAASYVKWYNL